MNVIWQHPPESPLPGLSCPTPRCPTHSALQDHENEESSLHEVLSEDSQTLSHSTHRCPTHSASTHDSFSQRRPGLDARPHRGQAGARARHARHKTHSASAPFSIHTIQHPQHSASTPFSISTIQHPREPSSIHSFSAGAHSPAGRPHPPAPAPLAPAPA